MTTVVETLTAPLKESGLALSLPRPEGRGQVSGLAAKGRIMSAALGDRIRWALGIRGALERG